MRDTNIHTALGNTLIMMILTVVFELGLGVLFALFVDSIRRGAKFYRTVFFFPVVISVTAIGLMFVLFYEYNIGLFNQLLMKFGAEKHLWMTTSSALYMSAIPTIWQYVGFYFVLILTGISTIPEDIYESAYLDGITGILKIFDLAWIIAPKGIPDGSTYLLGTYQYNMVYEAYRVEYGCAIAVLIVVLGLGISLLVMAALLFPAFATIVPVFTILLKAGLNNTHLGVILPQIAGNLAFAIAVMVGFMAGIPLELEEAAGVEGCNAWQIFLKIVVPISKPSFATVAIFTFLWS